MSIAYLNGEYLPLTEARISPLDRGFLFGDGLYEVIPSYGGKLVGFSAHIQRFQSGMQTIQLKHDWTEQQWREVVTSLIEQNGSGDLGVYIHISRGADTKRLHAFPDNVTPTVFLFTYELPPAPSADLAKAKGLRVVSSEDMRWQHCNIKTTSLLGNVLHYQQGFAKGVNETILFNQQQQLTEASSCNVFIVKNGVIKTPPLDNHLLPGITRYMLLDILRKDGSIEVQECAISMDQVRDADEVWLTSSSKDIAPVIELDGQPVADGKIGPMWLRAMQIYTQHKFSY
ncbi:D-amino acid aminotransferase [Alteromonadaceae bacterium BrNp21-10]|nr:D-amino acid aminotransferase [Alteromonadaceae bacterium BrNp21-10]